MKSFNLNKGRQLQLPEKWDEIPSALLPKIFAILMDVIAQKLNPVEARLQFLYMLVKYHPSATKKNRQTINFNLFRLSEQLTFAFKIDDNKIIPNLQFSRNPIPILKCGRKKYPGRDFVRDFTVKTDITAREFADCFDFYLEYYRNPDKGELCITNICATLYKIPEIPKFTPLHFGIFIWFSGIINFFYNHHIYSILFGKPETVDSDSDKINLGMTETILGLIHEGYSSDMNLIDFFNVQIKLLKDNINKAVASGAKITDIARQTKLSISIIQKFV
jgi:hypothetical protein